MKFSKITAALVAALTLGAIGTASAQSVNGGTITFTGSVADVTCTVQGGAGTNGGSGNFTVSLNQAQPSDLPSAGATFGQQAFDLIIGGPNQTSCQDGSVASVQFIPSSPQVDAATGALRNALSGQATNVEIQVLDSNNAPINLAAGNLYASPAIANNTATMQFGAQYLAVGGGATPGLVSTEVLYGVTYN